MVQVNTQTPVTAPAPKRTEANPPGTARPEATLQAPAPAAQPSINPIPAGDLMKVYFGGVNDALDIAKSSFSKDQYQSFNEVLNFNEYLNRIYDNPRTVQNAYQRIYDMIMSKPVHVTDEVDPETGDPVLDYEFFTNPDKGIPLVGKNAAIHRLVKMIKAAARGGEIGNRVLMAMGPVGSGKSLMLDHIKRGLEDYTRTDSGRLYGLQWANLPKEVAEELKLAADDAQEKLANSAEGVFKDYAKYVDEQHKAGELSDEEAATIKRSLAGMAKNFVLTASQVDINDSGEGLTLTEPMNVDPLLAVSNELIEVNGKTIRPREAILADVTKTFADKNDGKLPYRLSMKGELPPVSKLVQEKLREYYAKRLQPGESLEEKVLSHVQAKRIIFDETERLGISTYQPKDEKNQDSTELNGGTDFMQLLKYGRPDHPMVLSPGEFAVANRGIIHLEEGLKLQKEFLYDLLTVAQERKIKPKDSAQISLDVAAIITTNRPEFDKLQKDKTMEAMQIRLATTPDPYLKNYKDEIGIYENGSDVREAKARGIHIAPHTLELAAKWAVATRLKPSETFKLTPFEKASIFAGEEVNGLGEEIIPALEDEAGRDEAHYGISPRVLQNALSNALNTELVEQSGTLTPWLLLRQVRKELKHGTLNEADKVPTYLRRLVEAEKELKSRLKQDVFKAYYETTGKQELRENLVRYVRELKAWAKDKQGASEDFMRSIEKHVNVAPNALDNYRESLLERLLQVGDPLEVITQDENLSKALLEQWIEEEKNKFIEHTRVDDEAMQPLVDKLTSEFGYNDYSAQEAIRVVQSSL